jgi:hypothetical protein
MDIKTNKSVVYRKARRKGEKYDDEALLRSAEMIRTAGRWRGKGHSCASKLVMTILPGSASAILFLAPEKPRGDVSLAIDATNDCSCNSRCGTDDS